MGRLTLTRSAELVETYWHYDEAAGRGEDRTRTIERLSPYVMHSLPCFFEEGLLLRDVFRFMSKHLDFLSLTLGPECVWVVEEGLQDPGPDDGDLDYVQLYWHLETQTFRGEITTRVPERMDFDGVGKADPAGGAGTRYAIEFSTANDLARYPIRIDPRLELSFSNLDAKSGASEPALPLGDARPTLFQVLYGIVWEISFFGTPEGREREKRILDERIRSIDEGTARLVPLEQVLGDDDHEPDGPPGERSADDVVAP